MVMNDAFELVTLENAVYGEDFELAALELHKLLRLMDKQEISPPHGDPPTPDFYPRAACAVSALMSNARFPLSDEGYQALIPFHRYLSTLFAISGLGSADHLIRQIGSSGTPESGSNLTFTGPELFKLALLYHPSYAGSLDLKQLWVSNPALGRDLCLAILSHPVLMSEAAHRRREEMLEWLPEFLGAVSLDPRHIQYVHMAWMHCSYGLAPGKHALKRSLNSQIRRLVLAGGAKEPALIIDRPPRAKPVMLLPLENFWSRHAMYRCYAPAIRALRERFHLVALVRASRIDAPAREIFDEVHTVDETSLNDAVAAAIRVVAACPPDVIYYPSVGMWMGAIALSTLRLAPLQVMTLGHPATSNSETMDFVIVEESFLGSPECFSERVVTVPDRSMPFTMRGDAVDVAPDIRENPSAVRCAVPATVMKLNAPFLALCRRIAEEASRPVEFHVFPGTLNSLYLHSRLAISQWLPNARVYPYMDYPSYVRNVNRCDIHLSSFPFGNTNGLVDSVRQGLPVVCMDGDEVHSRVDVGLSKRLGLPDSLIARSEDEYARIVHRLIDDDGERVRISRRLLEQDVDGKLFAGNAGHFAEAMWWLYRNRTRVAGDSRRLWSTEERAVLDGHSSGP